MRLAVLVGTTLIAAAPLAAQSSPVIVSARNAGQVGERYDGYMGYPSSASASVRSQVDAVNIRRRSLYTGLAGARGVSPGEVSIAAGCELLRTVSVGQAYLLSDNVWRRRAAGQPAPVPNYCGL
ncbi:MAG: YdbL family protein [Sphingomicrobium sp.]